MTIFCYVFVSVYQGVSEKTEGQTDKQTNRQTNQRNKKTIRRQPQSGAGYYNKHGRLLYSRQRCLYNNNPSCHSLFLTQTYPRVDPL